MRICPKCSAENPEDAGFCNLCYRSFEAESGEGRESDLTHEAAREPGTSVRCPNCGTIGPASGEFCGRCGFAFSGTERLGVEPEEQLGEEQERLDTLRRETRDLMERPLTVTADTDGSELMRRLAESLEQGYRPRVRAAGKEPIAMAVKLLARMSEEFGARDEQLWVQTHFVDSRAVRYLEELAVELVLVLSARAS